jgi:hypothetical protein
MTIPQLRQAAKDLREIAIRVLLYSEKNSLEDVWQKLEQLFRQVPQVRGKRAVGSRWKACPKAGVRFRNAQTTSCRLARLQSLQQAKRSQGTTGKCLDDPGRIYAVLAVIFMASCVGLQGSENLDQS